VEISPSKGGKLQPPYGWL